MGMAVLSKLVFFFFFFVHKRSDRILESYPEKARMYIYTELGIIRFRFKLWTGARPL